IGRDSQNAIVLLSGAVDQRHARIDIVSGNPVVIDHRSKSGTYVNGARVASRRVLARFDKLTIGPCTVAILPPVDPAQRAPYRPRDDTETALLADVVAGDPPG